MILTIFFNIRIKNFRWVLRINTVMKGIKDVKTPYSFFQVQVSDLWIINSVEAIISVEFKG